MKPVRCSWVDMQKIREALSSEKRGDQAALGKMRCVDDSTVNDWQATVDIMQAMESKVGISRLSTFETFQPSHAKLLARHFRRTVGKNPAKWDADAVVEWVERCELKKWTVNQFRSALLAAESASASSDAGGRRSTADLNSVVVSGIKYGTIYADPPWAYSNQATRASTNNHYDTLTVEQLCALPVRDLAAERSHLWLWTTNGFLFECPHLFEAWGFEFKSSYVWIKPQMGIGNYLRNAHELLLLAVRGGLTAPADARNVMSWGQFDRTAHSAKPERIRVDVVERLSPGPRLELFGRREVDDWMVWGNQVVRGLLDPEQEELK